MTWRRDGAAWTTHCMQRGPPTSSPPCHRAAPTPAAGSKLTSRSRRWQLRGSRQWMSWTAAGAYCDLFSRVDSHAAVVARGPACWGLRMGQLHHCAMPTMHHGSALKCGTATAVMACPVASSIWLNLACLPTPCAAGMCWCRATMPVGCRGLCIHCKTPIARSSCRCRWVGGSRAMVLVLPGDIFLVCVFNLPASWSVPHHKDK